MGSINTPYSIPNEAAKIFHDSILQNDLVPSLPAEIKDAAQAISFEGNDKPSIPINWKFAESITALKAFEASMLNVLRMKKYGAPPADVKINSDHASLFFMSPFLSQVLDNQGKAQDVGLDPKALEKVGIKNYDKHRATATLHQALATNIYQTKDHRCYHIHGSMNPEPTMTALGETIESKEASDDAVSLGVPLKGKDADSYDSMAQHYNGVVGRLDSKELDELMNEKAKQAGVICLTQDEFRASEHGKANARVGLYELQRSETATQAASWWPEDSSMPSSAKRPLAGLKVVDLTRVIAAPSITRSLAEMGASVMRVTSPNVTDMSSLHLDLNWGKWNCHIDLKSEQGRAALADLMKDADVVVEGYRPGVMEKYGFGRQGVFDLVKDRERGIVHVKENCYGWNGPWQHRSGWQQISDACCGVSMEYGRAMGNDEAVTPVFPNSDYCTGVVGSTAVLHALIRRSEEGGSFGVNVSLNYYSQWLTTSVGTYPSAIWNDVWNSHGSPVFRHYHNMGFTLPAMFKMLKENSSEKLFQKEFFAARESKAVGHTFVQVKPISRFEGGEVELRYNVGTRGNGVDKAVWPRDLSVEVVV